MNNIRPMAQWRVVANVVGNAEQGTHFLPTFYVTDSDINSVKEAVVRIVDPLNTAVKVTAMITSTATGEYIELIKEN